jgi:class 3 adenylate cyclase
MATREEFVACGLLGVPGEGPDRLELLTWLDELGFSLDEMVAANAVGSLSALAGDHRMMPVPSITRTEAAARSGLDVEQIDTYATAFGFAPVGGSPPGEVGFNEDEVDVFVAIRLLSSIFTPEEAIGFMRVLGSSLGRIGEAVVSMFLADIEQPHQAAGEGELSLARKVYDAVGLLDGFAERLDPLLRRQVRQAIERTRGSFVLDDKLTFRVAVGFVDLVGFTERSNDLAPAELAVFIRDFEGRAHDVAISCGARVVKLIGDEVMFVSIDPAAVCRAAAALMEGFGTADDLVLPRGGLAFGKVLARGGDYYGSVVNLASRLADQAVPQEVLATTELVDAARGSCQFEPAGRRMVKGFDQAVTVWSLGGTP